MNEFTGNPDAHIQRPLDVRAQMIVPFPGNNYSVELDVFTRICYLDYVPVFKTLHGKRWVLRPHVVSVSGDRAKVNIFSVVEVLTSPPSPTDLTNRLSKYLSETCSMRSTATERSWKSLIPAKIAETDP